MKAKKWHIGLLAIAVVAVCATMSSCGNEAQARSRNAESGVCRRLKAEKANRYGHSYVYFYDDYAGYDPINVVHDPDCPCQKGGSK